MNKHENRYTRYSLPREMLETIQVVQQFDIDSAWAWVQRLVDTFQYHSFSRILFTGEGSSRIFPAKAALYSSCKQSKGVCFFTEGCTQALDYDLSDTLVVGASNSGKTKELIHLFKALKVSGHRGLFGITAHENTILGELSQVFILSCGSEEAVAATKSVVEQALVTQLVVHVLYNGTKEEFIRSLSATAQAVEQALTVPIPPGSVQALARSPIVYFAGRNTGVAEELALKTNEITRKKSVFLEGTLAIHGIEEVMDKVEALVIVEPFESEEIMFQKHLIDAVGINIVAIASRQTSFPTVIIPSVGVLQQIVELAAGWNLLVEAGLAFNVDMDKPKRARKVGNEFFG